MNNIDKQYLDLLKDILKKGKNKSDRTGTGTISVFGKQLRHDMSLGFPIITTKKVVFKTVVRELLWFLRGETNIKHLIKQNCHIWDGDAYKAYCKFASKVEEPDYNIHVDDPRKNCTRLMTMKEFITKIKSDDEFANRFGELGPIYGRQWRKWKKVDGTYTRYIDQIKNVIRDLKQNPDSRRIIVSAWNVSELENMTLPPCHNFFQFYTRELSISERLVLVSKTYNNFEPFDFFGIKRLEHSDIDKLYPVPRRSVSLMFNMRSCDVPLGLPFNISSYAILLELIAMEVNMQPDELIVNIGDAHIYKNQIDGAKEQVKRNTKQLPKLTINNEFWNHDTTLLKQINYIQADDFFLTNYQHHEKIDYPLSN